LQPDFFELCCVLDHSPILTWSTMLRRLVHCALA